MSIKKGDKLVYDYRSIRNKIYVAHKDEKNGVVWIVAPNGHLIKERSSYLVHATSDEVANNGRV